MPTSAAGDERHRPVVPCGRCPRGKARKSPLTSPAARSKKHRPREKLVNLNRGKPLEGH